MLNIFYLLCILFLFSCKNENRETNIAFTGDVFLDRGVKDEILLHGDSILVNSLSRLFDQDFLIINYEGTFTNLNTTKIPGYKFNADERLASLLHRGGVTHASVSNNHSFDYGEVGFQNTINALINNNIIPLGENCNPAIIKSHQNNKCAILSVSLTVNNENFCLSSLDILKRKVEEFEISNPLVPLILFIHWGLEYQHQPERWQRNLAKELVELGADAIIGHHPHVIQSIEFIDGTPVFYSIGNFVADAYLPNTVNSIIVEFTILNKIKDVKIRPVLIKNYFPQSINFQEQLTLVKEYLSYSDGICSYKVENAWHIKPTKNINFQEKTDIWVFTENQIIISVKKLKEEYYLLNVNSTTNTSNTISLHGQLSEIQINDINNDGDTDILLGITKKVNFDPKIKKRINIYSYNNNILQPLWFGTKFIYDIENFDVIKNDFLNFLSTQEIDSLGNTYNGIYVWDEFGFALNSLNKER